MKVLIVYDTVSPTKLTAKIAETIANVLKEKGIDVDSFFIKDTAVKVDVKSYDCLLVGSPTMYWKLSSGIKQFLNGFSEKEFPGKMAAAFDTQMRSRMSGNAAEGIEKKLKKMGFRIITPPLVVHVEGKINAMYLQEGEQEKTKSWALEVARTLSEQSK